MMNEATVVHAEIATDGRGVSDARKLIVADANACCDGRRAAAIRRRSSSLVAIVKAEAAGCGHAPLGSEPYQRRGITPSKGG
jgi:hypothetical protein